MKRADKQAHRFWTRLLVFMFITGGCVWGFSLNSFSQQPAEVPKNTADKSDPAVIIFRERVKDYVAMRERLEETLPKLSKDATPEQIKTHQDAFVALVQKERIGAKQGEFFTPDIVTYIRKTIQQDMSGLQKKRMKKTVTEEKPQVPLRINYPYPDEEEMVTMSPVLLLKLPTMPKQMRYLFSGRHLLLVDRETRLIIDYTLNILPQR